MKKVELKLDVVRVAPDAEVGRWEDGHYREDNGLIFLIAGSNNAPGWGIGGWDETGEGRLVTGGPKVRGPHAYFVALCGVIDNYGGTGAILQEADDQGRLYRVAAGDAIVINGVEFTVTVNTSGYAKLTKGAS